MPVNLRLETTIDKTGNQPVIRVKDITDYGSVTVSLVKIFITLKGPLGVIHLTGSPSTPEIDRSATDVTVDYLIPLTSTEEVPNGSYAVEWSWTINDIPEDSGQIDFEYLFTEPKPMIGVKYSCLKSELISTDLTQYTIEGQDYIGTTLSHDIKWPIESELPEEKTSAVEVVLGPNIWTGDFYVKLVSLPRYYIAEDVIVIAKIYTGKSVKVVCDVDYCKISEAIENLIKQRDCMKNKASGEYQRLDYVIGRATELAALAEISKTCDEQRVEDIYRDLFKLLNSYDCGCQLKVDGIAREVEPMIGGCCNNLYTEW